MGEATFTARNFATASENKIHDDAIARLYGFTGGLVPGVTSYGYLAETVFRAHGTALLDNGSISVRFGSPVYEGEAVTAKLAHGGALSLRNPTGDVCVTGEVGDARRDARAIPELASLPERRPTADETNLAVGVTLGTLYDVASHEHVDGYLDAVEIEATSRRVVHPAWLLLAANDVLVQNVRLGPWIHVGSDVQLVGRVHYDDLVETRALVTANFERKGHRFVELDVVGLVDHNVVTRVRHTAIYQLRR
jgi:acyl dehydratase